MQVSLTVNVERKFRYSSWCPQEGVCLIFGVHFKYRYSNHCILLMCISKNQSIKYLAYMYIEKSTL